MKSISSVVVSTNSEDAVPANGKEDATIIRMVINPIKGDTLFTVNDYYLNGKLKFTCKGTPFDKRKPNCDITFEGASIEFFPNGHKRRIVTFTNGSQSGDILEYFPNGKLNTIKTIPDVDMSEYRLLLKGITTDEQRIAYRKLIDSVARPLLKLCQDSTGNVLAENGSGKWVEYRNNYRIAFAEGSTKNGFPDGEWHGQICDTIKYTSTYNNGYLLNGKSYTSNGKEYTFNEIKVLPEMGGISTFGRYLGRKIRYPADARERGEQGKVILQFTVDVNGLLSNIRIIRSVYHSIDAEALSAIVESPAWQPGYSYGVKTNVVVRVPVSFTLQNY